MLRNTMIRLYKHIHRHRSKNVLKTIAESKTLYDIVTALRGPDSKNSGLKYIFTSRIRHLALQLKISDTPHVGWERNTKYFTSHNIAAAVMQLHPYDIHYLHHVLDALNSLHSLNLINTDEYICLSSLAQVLLGLACSLHFDNYIKLPQQFEDAMNELKLVIENECNSFIEG